MEITNVHTYNMNRLTSSIRTQVPSSDRAINKFRLCLRSYRPNDERAPVKLLSDTPKGVACDSVIGSALI